MKSGWMVVAGFLFALMGVFVKLGGTYFNSTEMVFYRSLIGLVVLHGVIKYRHYSIATPYWRWHVWRGLSGLVALLLFFHAMTALPLATAITLNYTSPIFLAVFSAVVLKEQHRKRLWLALLVGFIGVILVLRPTFDQGRMVAGLMGLGSGVLAGVAYLNVRQLGQLNEPEWRVVYYFTLISTIGAGIWMLLREFHALTWRGGMLLLGIGFTATLAQLAMTRAYRTGKTLVAGSLAYSTVVFASLLGFLVWGEALTPEAWIGIGLIILGGVASVWTTQPRASAL